MFIVGLINSMLSFLTFYGKDSRTVGCGIYLLTLSITSLLTISMLVVKFWFVLFTHINSSIDRSILHGGCLFIEPLLKVFLYLDNWLNACVAIERAITVFQGIKFNRARSKRLAQWIILSLPLFIMSTLLHEPLHRGLFDNWCITRYSRFVQDYNTSVLFFHFLTPFFANLFSTLFIVFTVARHRSITHNGRNYKEHVRTQLNKHKQLLVSSVIVVILSSPRLIISLLSGCVKTSNYPWLYLASYFISFIPSVLVFVAFVLPSNLYKRQFREFLQICRQRLR